MEEEKQLKDFLYNDEHLGLNEKQIHEFEEATKVKTVDFIEIGTHRIEAWYFSPLPKGISNNFILFRISWKYTLHM